MKNQQFTKGCLNDSPRIEAEAREEDDEPQQRYSPPAQHPRIAMLPYLEGQRKNSRSSCANTDNIFLPISRLGFHSSQSRSYGVRKETLSDILDQALGIVNSTSRTTAALPPASPVLTN